jgi:uncharacterized protein (TIGR02268 family)
VLCLTPELTTTFLFDTKLARVELQERERFLRVVPAEDVLTLVASETLRDEKPLRLTIYFQDGVTPASVDFLLVVHPALATRQVEVIQRTRLVELSQREAREAQARAQKCEEEKERMWTEQNGPGGLRGLRHTGLMNTNTGVHVEDIGKKVKAKPGNVVDVPYTWTYRTWARVAVEVKLVNSGAKPWTPAGSLLRGAQGEELTPLPQWRPEPILPGQEARVMVEVEAMPWQALGSYTLTLWDADRRAVVLRNVTFPK